ncbi:Secreted TPR-repeat containing protein [Pseudoalteromonas luteoviolacea B = ATCC 29581]|nr:Secreted TPR-repeat containing protein [Pseudoalteromonas luteoviolacea B = ATCC 29581]
MNVLFLLIVSIFGTAYSQLAHAKLGLASDFDKAKQAMQTDLDLAQKYIEKALLSNSTHAEVHYLCGRIMGQQASNATLFALSYASKSLACLKKAVELEPNNTAYRMGLMSFYLGAPRIAGGDEQLAWEQVDAVSRLNDLEGTLAKLTYYRKTEAVADYQKLLAKSRENYPQQAEFHYRHGLVLQGNQQYADAIAVFRAAIKAKSDDSDKYKFNAWYQIGRTALFSKQWLEDGIMALNYFVDNAPNSNDFPNIHWAHFRLAQLHQLTGNRTLMNDHLKLANDNTDKELQREIRRLQK